MKKRYLTLVTALLMLVVMMVPMMASAAATTPVPPSEVQSQAQEILNQAIADGKVSENAKLDLAFQVYNLDYQQGDATIADATKATGIWRYIVQSVTAEDMNAVIYVAEGGGDVAPFEAFSMSKESDNGRAPKQHLNTALEKFARDMNLNKDPLYLINMGGGEGNYVVVGVDEKGKLYALAANDTLGTYMGSNVIEESEFIRGLEAYAAKTDKADTDIQYVVPAPIDNSLRNTIIVVAVVVVLAAIVIAIIVIYRKKHKIVVRYAPTDPRYKAGADNAVDAKKVKKTHK
ncbi:MAG: hypothetical protein ACOYJA_12140 [Christensenellales bacterium]|jgi:uncharacterized membrane protein